MKSTMHVARCLTALPLLACSLLSPSLGQVTDSLAVAATGKSVSSLRSDSNLSVQANNLNLNQWVRHSHDKTVRGSVHSISGSEQIPLPSLHVALIRDGVLAFQSKTDVEGDFLIDDVTPGVYSLVASGENQLIICSLTVLEGAAGQHLPDRVHLRSIHPSSKRIGELIRSNTMPHWEAGIQHSEDPLAASRNFAGTASVQLDRNGGFSGRLSRANASVDLSSTLVYLVREGREISRTRALSSGDYHFDAIEPGPYGLVASGPEGIAAVGIDVYLGDLALSNPSFAKLVKSSGQDNDTSEQNPVPQTMNLELAEPNCFQPQETIPIEECVVLEEAPCCPTLCCSSWGGGGGGGGGGTGAGGWGTLAAIGALAAVAIAKDHDDEAPASPIK
jgi:hypothetical protein